MLIYSSRNVVINKVIILHTLLGHTSCLPNETSGGIATYLILSIAFNNFSHEAWISCPSQSSNIFSQHLLALFGKLYSIVCIIDSGRPILLASFFQWRAYSGMTWLCRSASDGLLLPVRKMHSRYVYVTGPAKIDHLSTKNCQYFSFLLYHNLTIYTTKTKSSSLL